MEYELQQNWDKILEHMHIAFSISDVVFRTFIKKLNVYSVQDNLLTILIDDTEIGDSKSFIQKKYSTFLAASIEEITGVHYQLKFISLSELDPINRENKTKAPEVKRNIPSNINPNYTFDTFIVGDGSVQLFRPQENFKRMNNSAERMVIPKSLTSFSSFNSLLFANE